MLLRKLLVVIVLFIAIADCQAEDMLVSASASLTDVLSDLGKRFELTHPGAVVKFRFGTSGSLEKQIEHGAPADVFIPAAKTQMDQLAAKNLIDTTSRIDIAENEVVLIAPLGTVLKTWDDLRGGQVHRIAIGDPQYCPIGNVRERNIDRFQRLASVDAEIHHWRGRTASFDLCNDQQR